MRSKQVDVFCAYSVVIHLMPTAIADIEMSVMLTVFLVNAPASRTTLARVSSRDFKHKRFVCKSFVDELLLEVVERP